MRSSPEPEPGSETAVRIPVGRDTLDGTLVMPERSRGLVVFAHGSGSSRHSARNGYVAGILQEAGFATLLMDLLTRDEDVDVVDARTGELRFDVARLAARLAAATDWLGRHWATWSLPVGYFGASTGAAAALIAAAERPEQISAVVSRGGRPDLAGAALERVRAPTLLIVGARDIPVIDLNRQALASLVIEARLSIVPGATHLFEEPGTLEQAARLACDWFERHRRTEATAA